MGWRARTNFVLPSAVVAPSGTRRQHEEHRDEARAQRVIDEMRRWHSIFGHPPSARNWNRAALRKAGRLDLLEAHDEHGPWPNFTVVQKAFGSWAAGIEAAGFTRPAKGTDYGQRSRTPDAERLLAKVAPDDNGCWLWTGAVPPHGYVGWNTSDGRRTVAHRALYELLVGPIPDGLQLDHLCRVRHCLNPDHLEPVTAQENNLRSESPSALNARKTHCVNGHPLSGDNLHVQRGGGRACKACKNEWGRNKRRRAADERAAQAVLYGDQTRTGDVWVLGPSGSYSFRDMRPWEEL